VSAPFGHDLIQLVDVETQRLLTKHVAIRAQNGADLGRVPVVTGSDRDRISGVIEEKLLNRRCSEVKPKLLGCMLSRNTGRSADARHSDISIALHRRKERRYSETARPDEPHTRLA
ncbi:uncharacterized protein METZ01_LOCUS365252, partial [marine metagenome]